MAPVGRVAARSGRSSQFTSLLSSVDARASWLNHLASETRRQADPGMSATVTARVTVVVSLDVKYVEDDGDSPAEDRPDWPEVAAWAGDRPNDDQEDHDRHVCDNVIACSSAPDRLTIRARGCRRGQICRYRVKVGECLGRIRLLEPLLKLRIGQTAFRKVLA